MKLTCFIVSTLLIVLVTQQSTNGLPVDNITTQRPCLEGFELLDGKCQPILSSSPKSDTKLTRSKVGKAALSYEGTTEESKKLSKSEPCPEGKFRTKSGDCKNIVFEDQSSTTIPKSKKLNKTPEEREEKPFDYTTEPVEYKLKPKLGKDKPEQYEKELLDYTSTPVVKENESFDTPKGCPPGTKVDEQGACQDEVEYTSTTLVMNLKDLLPKDGSCPAGMELFKNKCIYIKSKDNSTVDGLTETEGPIVGKANTENKLVPMLKGGVCPPETEYYSNGLCRVRTRAVPVDVLVLKEKCLVGEILIDGKCQRKDSELSKTSKVPSKPKPFTQAEEKPVKSL